MAGIKAFIWVPASKVRRQILNASNVAHMNRIVADCRQEGGNPGAG